MATTREDSRIDFGSRRTAEDISTGCLQRIADALEAHLPVLAKNHAALTEDNERLKRLLFRANSNVTTMIRRCAALRGQITKLKKAGK
jgi:hypothetical protein